MVSATATTSSIAQPWRTKSSWEELVKQKILSLQDDLPAAWRLSVELLERYRPSSLDHSYIIDAGKVLHDAPFFSDHEFNITEHNTATQLVGKLARGELTAVEVTTAFCKRAAIAGQLLSCLTETFYSKALDRAKTLDEHFKQTGKTLGPLHGLPISIKDSFDVGGITTTCGFVALLEVGQAKKNAPLVDMLLDLGAVLYVKTNVPQTMMTADSENHIYGRALNPLNTALTAGGSSGSESSLVAFKGAPLGVGTDIAGSVRVPALCCGLYGFRSTADRLPLFGQESIRTEFVYRGIPKIQACAGPIAHTMEDLELFMASVIGQQPWNYDSLSFAVPWHTSFEAKTDTNTKLRIGVLPEHPEAPLHPPVRRAYHEAIARLQKAGHEMIHLPEDPATDINLANRIAYQYYFYGPKKADLLAASGEPMVKSVVGHINPLFTGDLPVSMEADLTTQMEGLWSSRAKYTDAWRKVWVDNKLDIVLCPGAHCTAVAHDTWGWPFYTAIWNLTDFPSLVIPFGRVSKELDPDGFPAKSHSQPGYDPELIDGAPCGVQIVAPKFQDEACLWAGKIIDRVLHQ
ncbi:hypothetical protein M409DRAFT_53310 [Zasmidium cellare ATCC 36951]|uniref:Amidase domain-containing protein n=1 Tax=Zasmidium cellare ATCC 36951 TaxID=1080233 RepID=A0A6A6CNG2_ZASCE|nr:uncharacterized protein M409DRAFT_53310 [Zasmidium cellare ATCC 36951]KAF2168675.1 hypothetical protein M409DRAFT_53310 [Zasmidium cellare ATCC 36951]